ncbi:hypothetical protein Trydic_g10899 [Trypoxylus dichotomus]
MTAGHHLGVLLSGRNRNGTTTSRSGLYPDESSSGLTMISAAAYIRTVIAEGLQRMSGRRRRGRRWCEDNACAHGYDLSSG